MTASRVTSVLAATVSAFTLAMSSCSTEPTQTVTDRPSASTTSSPAPPTTTETPASSSEIATSEPSTTTPTSSTRTPEEVSDLWPWSQPRPDADSGTVDPAAYETAPDAVNFTTPDGNVQCGIFGAGAPEGQVGCQAVTGSAPFDGPECTNAENDKYAVRVDASGPRHFCTTQGIYTAPDPRVLDYSQVLSTNDVVCESDEIMGVTCWGTGGAFTFSDEWNVTFGRVS